MVILLRLSARSTLRLGYDETTTAEIAKRAGIAVGSVYDYFTDKRAILLEVLHDTVEVVANIVIQGLAPSERWREEDPTLIVRGLVHQVFHARRVNPGMQRILWERFFKDPEFRAATMAIEERVQGAIVSTLAELKAAGKLRIDDVKTAAYVIQLSVEWVSSRLILGEEETLNRLLGPKFVRVDYLEGHLAANLCVPRQVHLGHPASSKKRDNLELVNEVSTLRRGHGGSWPGGRLEAGRAL